MLNLFSFEQGFTRVLYNTKCNILDCIILSQRRKHFPVHQTVADCFLLNFLITTGLHKKSFYHEWRLCGMERLDRPSKTWWSWVFRIWWGLCQSKSYIIKQILLSSFHTFRISLVRRIWLSIDTQLDTLSDQLINSPCLYLSLYWYLEEKRDVHHIVKDHVRCFYSSVALKTLCALNIFNLLTKMFKFNICIYTSRFPGVISQMVCNSIFLPTAILLIENRSICLP